MGSACWASSRRKSSPRLGASARWRRGWAHRAAGTTSRRGLRGPSSTQRAQPTARGCSRSSDRGGRRARTRAGARGPRVRAGSRSRGARPWPASALRAEPGCGTVRRSAPGRARSGESRASLRGRPGCWPPLARGAPDGPPTRCRHRPGQPASRAGSPGWRPCPCAPPSGRPRPGAAAARVSPPGARRPRGAPTAPRARRRPRAGRRCGRADGRACGRRASAARRVPRRWRSARARPGPRQGAPRGGPAGLAALRPDRGRDRGHGLHGAIGERLHAVLGAGSTVAHAGQERAVVVGQCDPVLSLEGRQLGLAEHFGGVPAVLSEALEERVPAREPGADLVGPLGGGHGVTQSTRASRSGTIRSAGRSSVSGAPWPRFTQAVRKP